MQPFLAFYTHGGDSNLESRSWRTSFFYLRGCLLSLSFHQTFIKPQCCGGRWLSGTRDKVGLRIMLVPGTSYRMFPLLLFNSTCYDFHAF